MPASFDAIVVGLGAVGSAAAYHLAVRGRRVLGIDRYASPHTHGSSHGGSRIIRKAYFEGARYLPLLRRAYALWRKLEKDAGLSLLRLTGGLAIGAKDGVLVKGARRSAEAHGVKHEILSADEVKRRFPAFRLPEGHVALWEPEAGALHPERCIRAHLSEARRHGAELHMREPVVRWEARSKGVEVETERGTYQAHRLVLCAGGWIKDLAPALAQSLSIERQVNGWFRPTARAEQFAPSRCPVYIWEYAPEELLYGFPDFGEGVKVGLHHGGEEVDHPQEVRRETTAEDEEVLRKHLRPLLPDADGPPVRMETCFYTNTPDEDYLIDRHSEHSQVLVVSACSGHGFKASSAVGEALADLVDGKAPRFDIEPFRLRWDTEAVRGPR